MQKVRETCQSMSMHLRHSLSKRTKDSSHPPIIKFCWPLQPCSAVKGFWLFLRTGKVASSLPPDDSVHGIQETNQHTFQCEEKLACFLDQIYRRSRGRPYEDFSGTSRIQGSIFPRLVERAPGGDFGFFLLRHIMMLRANFRANHMPSTETKKFSPVVE